MPHSDAAVRKEYNKDYQRKRCQRLKAPPGICSYYPNCTQPSDGVHRKCAHHLAYMREYKKVNRKPKELGTCARSDCRGVRDPGYASCTSCRDRDKTAVKLRKKEVLAAYGGSCVCCGEGNQEFLTIDHIAGDGAAHRRTLTCRLYTWLKKNNYPAGFRVLCMNCNFSLGCFGYCPHGLTQGIPVRLKRGPKEKGTKV